MNINIGDRIQLGDKSQMQHSVVPEKYAHNFATIIKVNKTHIVCEIDHDIPGYQWYVNFDDFICISKMSMPQKEDLFEFLGY